MAAFVAESTKFRVPVILGLGECRSLVVGHPRTCVRVEINLQRAERSFWERIRGDQAFGAKGNCRSDGSQQVWQVAGREEVASRSYAVKSRP
jgi:hypothetical protein